MAAPRVVEYVKETFSGVKSVKLEVIEDQAKLDKEFPLLGAVNRAASGTVRPLKLNTVSCILVPLFFFPVCLSTMQLFVCLSVYECSCVVGCPSIRLPVCLFS